MKNHILITGLLCACFLAIEGFAQSKPTFREKRADRHYESLSYHKAIKLYHKVLDQDPGNHRVKLKLAESYFKQNDPVKAEEWYAQVINKTYLVKSYHYLHYAQVLQSNGKFNSSLRWAKKYLGANPKSEVAQNLVYSLQNVDRYYQDSSKYVVTPVNFNSAAADFAPSYYNDGLVFSSSRKQNLNLEKNYSWDKSKYLDLYYTEPSIAQEMFVEPTKLKGRVNSRLHEGPATFFQDDRRIIFTRNNPQEQSRLHLYAAELPTGSDQWEQIESLPFNSKNYSVGHPAMAASGAELYFVSDMPGGQGGTDIYKVLYVRGNWGIPQNLGPEINTPGNEMFPFVDQDDKLYFASNGHPGLGGLDIYSVNLKEETPVITNMGYPINSSKDDFGLIVNHDRKLGYYSSNRSGNDDIYQFVENYETIEIMVQGVDGVSAEEMVVSLKSKGNNLITKAPDAAGKVTFDVIPEMDYEIVTEAPDYLTASTSLNTSENTPSTVEVLMETAKPAPSQGTLLTVNNMEGTSSYIITKERVIEISSEENESWLNTLLIENNISIEDQVEINPIHYGFDQSNFESEYQTELDKLADLMTRFHNVEFELSSHTDSRGSQAYNKMLSQKRALSAEQYLIDQGVSKQRLFTMGYGEAKPLNECVDGHPCNNGKHLKNRRTEFRLVYMDENQVVSNY